VLLNQVFIFQEAEIGRTCLPAALKIFLKSNANIVASGVSSLDQLDQNLKDCEKGPLPEEVLAALDKAWKVSQPDTPNYWHLDLKYTYNTRKALFDS
jgi:aflatoxin B1 aldehyde reductase